MSVTRLPHLCAALVFLALPAMAEDLSGATDALNSFRAQHGLESVKWNKKLQKAAQLHANDMVKKGYFSHTSPAGSTLSWRMRKARYRACAAAENIAAGQDDLEAVLQTWIDSPGHRVNMLSPKVSEYGLAKAADDTWVMVLGARDC